MIVERMEFQIKFGQMKAALNIWKQIMKAMEADDPLQLDFRLMTDATGPSYMLITELNLRSLTEINPANRAWVVSKEVQKLYEDFKPLCESSKRMLYHVEHEI